MAANFVVVGFASIWLFDEPMTLSKGVGVVLICAGIAVVARG
jgi:multidrug transporter EmrE-like cation transporter